MTHIVFVVLYRLSSQFKVQSDQSYQLSSCRRWTSKLNYGKALLEEENYSEAIDAFNQAMQIDEGKANFSDADQLVYRGIALKKAGQSGFVKDWKEAANKGSKRAAQLLEENA